MQQRCVWLILALSLTACVSKNLYERGFIGVSATFPPTESVEVVEVNGLSLAESKEMDWPDHDAIGYTTVLASDFDVEAIEALGKRIGAQVAIVWRYELPRGSSTHGRGVRRRVDSTGRDVATEPPTRLSGKPLQKHQFQFEIAFLRRPEQRA